MFSRITKLTHTPKFKLASAAILLAAMPAMAQSGYLKTHGFDLAGSGTGHYQTPVTDQSPFASGTTDGVGFLANIREHPVPWFGLELDYSYNKYDEHYRTLSLSTPGIYVPVQQHAATAGYVFHVKTPFVQPFIVLGGGGVYFKSSRIQPPIGNGNDQPRGDQWRGAAMYAVGFDLTSKRQPHVGIRLQEHGLFYKAPDFYTAYFRSNSWVHQALPSAGVFYRF